MARSAAAGAVRLAVVATKESCQSEVARCQLSVASSQSTVASRQLSVRSCESEAASPQLPVASRQLPVCVLTAGGRIVGRGSWLKGGD